MKELEKRVRKQRKKVSVVMGKGLAGAQGNGEREGAEFQAKQGSKALLSPPANACWFYLTDGADDEKINLETPSATGSQVSTFSLHNGLKLCLF